MAFTLEPTTMIQIRKGLQSAEKRWNQIGWEYIGAKSPDLARVTREIQETGMSEWNGFVLFHPAK